MSLTLAVATERVKSEFRRRRAERHNLDPRALQHLIKRVDGRFAMPGSQDDLTLQNGHCGHRKRCRPEHCAPVTDGVRFRGDNRNNRRCVQHNQDGSPSEPSHRGFHPRIGRPGRAFAKRGQRPPQRRLAVALFCRGNSRQSFLDGALSAVSTSSPVRRATRRASSSTLGDAMFILRRLVLRRHHRVVGSLAG